MDENRKNLVEFESADGKFKELGVANQQLRAREQQLKAANQQLKAERNKLQAVVDAMEYGLTIQDRDYSIIYQNKVLEEVFGGLGDKCYKVYEGKDNRCDGCPVEKSYRDGKSHTTERKVTSPTGEISYWENTANPIKNAAGDIVSCLEIARNVTKKKQAEEELKAINQQLRASEQQLKATNQQLKANEQQLRAANQQLGAKEQALRESQEVLRNKMADLERFNKLMVGRELEMVKLKEEVNSLLEKSGETKKYNVT